MEAPPTFAPESRPTQAEVGRLAIRLLRELALYEPSIAELIREQGIDPTPEPGL